MWAVMGVRAAMERRACDAMALKLDENCCPCTRSLGARRQIHRPLLASSREPHPRQAIYSSSSRANAVLHTCHVCRALIVGDNYIFRTFTRVRGPQLEDSPSPHHPHPIPAQIS